MPPLMDSDFIRRRIWPVVSQLVHALADEKPAEARHLLVDRGPAAATLELVGGIGLEILLKLFFSPSHNRFRLGRVFVASSYNDVYVEYNWEQAGNYAPPSPMYSVTVRLQSVDTVWQVVEINPATMEAWFNSRDARDQLLDLEQTMGGTLPMTDWLLPLALLAGRLPLPFQPEALRDAVEATFLPQLQAQGFGLHGWIGGHRLWRDFVAQTRPALNEAEIPAWAAAVHYLMCEQDQIETSQAAVGQRYNVPLTRLLPRIRHLRQTLALQGMDERYTSLRSIQIPIQPATT